MICHFHILKYIKYHLERNVRNMYLAAVVYLRNDIFIRFVVVTLTRQQ